MAEIPVNFRHPLLVLENHCRRQVFTITDLAEWKVRQRVREANEFCWALARFLPAQLPALTQTKNHQVCRLWLVVKAKVVDIYMAYMRLKAEFEDFKKAGENEEMALNALNSKLFKKYQPTLFHRNMLGNEDPDLPFLPFHLSTAAVLPLKDTLSRCSRLYGFLEEIHAFKRTVKQQQLCNESADVAVLVNECRRLSTAQVEMAYVVVVKWNICVQASEVLVSQLVRVKARLHLIVASHPRGENAAVVELPFQEELTTYAAICYTNATKCRDKGHKKESGFWLSLVRKIHTAIGRDSLAMDIYYAEALRFARKHSEALTLFKRALRYINGHNYDDGSRAVVMQLVAFLHSDRYYFEKEVKWYQRLLGLGLGSRTNAVNLYSVHINLSNALRCMYRYEDSERILNRLKQTYPRAGTSLCNAYSTLYFSWERFAECEKWLKQGMSLRPREPSHFTADLIDLYLKLNRFNEAEPLLSVYLRKPGKTPLDRSYVMVSMSKQCQARGELGKARDWLDRAALLQNKYGGSKWYKARTLFFSGELSVESGEYGRAEEDLIAAIQGFQEVRCDEQHIMASCALANLYLLTQRISLAEEMLGIPWNLSEYLKHTTYSATYFEMQGRLSVAKLQFEKAKEWLDRALAIREKAIPHNREAGRIYIALGGLELAAGRYDEAYKCFTQALQLLRSCVSAAEAYSGLAHISVKWGDSQPAKTFLQEGLLLFKDLHMHPLASRLQAQLQALPE